MSHLLIHTWNFLVTRVGFKPLPLRCLGQIMGSLHHLPSQHLLQPKPLFHLRFNHQNVSSSHREFQHDLKINMFRYMNVITTCIVNCSSLSFQMVEVWFVVWTCKLLDKQRSPRLACMYCEIVNIGSDAYENVCVSWPKNHLYFVVFGGKMSSENGCACSLA